MQNKCMTAERKNLMSSRGTAVHTYDYIMKMNMFDGMVQSQEQYRAGENLAGETYYSVFQTRDMKMKLRKRPDGPKPKHGTTTARHARRSRHAAQATVHA